MNVEEASNEGERQRSTRRPLIYLAGAGILLLVALFAIWWFRPPEMNGVLLQSPQPAADFTLTASTGERVSLSDLRGQYVLFYFGYTFCPDVCPTTLNDLADMGQELGERRMDEVQVVFVTVDPERDSVEHLASYLPHFDPEFLGMTGTADEIDAVASQFGIFHQRHEGSEATGYLVDHTSTITVVDPEGYVRLIFRYGTSGEEMASDLKYLIRRG